MLHCFVARGGQQSPGIGQEENTGLASRVGGQQQDNYKDQEDTGLASTNWRTKGQRVQGRGEPLWPPWPALFF